jgi:hypothetical protein
VSLTKDEAVAVIGAINFACQADSAPTVSGYAAAGGTAPTRGTMPNYLIVSPAKKRVTAATAHIDFNARTTARCRAGTTSARCWPTALDPDETDLLRVPHRRRPLRACTAHEKVTVTAEVKVR